MIAAAPLKLDLAPTPTYKSRIATWLPAEDRSVEDCDGRLTIDLQRSLRAGAKVESDTYAIQEDLAQSTLDFRVFQVLNLTDPDQADVYETVISDDPHVPSRCSCMGSKCGHKRAISCKHIDALKAVEAAGGLPVPAKPQPEPKPASHPCGACNGFGLVQGPTHDRYGYEREPRLHACEYCGGSGRCEGGDRLVPERGALLADPRNFSLN